MCIRDRRYRADVLIEDHLGKIEEKMNKEVAKAAKKFGDAFDEAKFRGGLPITRSCRIIFVFPTVWRLP